MRKCSIKIIVLLFYFMGALQSDHPNGVMSCRPQKQHMMQKRRQRGCVAFDRPLTLSSAAMRTPQLRLEGHVERCKFRQDHRESCKAQAARRQTHKSGQAEQGTGAAKDTFYTCILKQIIHLYKNFFINMQCAINQNV